VFQTSKLYKDLNILKLKSLCYKNVCILMYDVKDNTVIPPRKYSTWIKSKSYVIVPNMRTVFG